VVVRKYLTNAAFSDRIDCRMKGLAERVRVSRVSKGMTQRDLEIESGLCEGYVSKIERGVKSDLTARTVGALAVALGVDIQWLAFGE